MHVEPQRERAILLAAEDFDGFARAAQAMDRRVGLLPVAPVHNHAPLVAEDEHLQTVREN
ncbi:hypothetical protein [Segniliparus rotundus]|uniref:hypothetical protein n=1 Tax=Segniliparus rotundus TaxID=286802 RepID=UPI0011D03DF3|nr:hypothetical protein [Segniliparus rotundus]